MKKPNGWYNTLYHESSCPPTIALIFKEPVSISNAISEMPIGNSYDITCDAPRIAAINENLLFEAHPPIIIP